MTIYYYGWEALAEWGTEDPAAYGTAVSPDQGFAWLRSARITVNENIERIWSIGGGTGRQASDRVKGTHEVGGALTFWLPDEMGDSANPGYGLWLLKFGLDAFNVGHSGADTITTTVLDYADLTGQGAVITIIVSGTTYTLTEGSDWTASSSNDATATSIASAMEALTGVTASATAAVVTATAESSYYISSASDDGPDEDLTTALVEAKWIVPNTGTSAYASNNLQSFTLEIGFNKTGSILMDQFVGCMVNSMTIRVAKGEKVEFSMDFFGKAASLNNTSFNNGSATTATSEPLMWNHCDINYGADNSATSRTEFTNFEVTFNNNLNRNYAIGQNDRKVTDMIVGQQEISGSITVNMSTTGGMEFWDSITGDASAPFDPSETVVSKELKLEIQNDTAPINKNIILRLRDVLYGEISVDIDPTKVQELTIPFTAKYYHCTFTTGDISAPTNWDDQS